MWVWILFQHLHKLIPCKETFTSSSQFLPFYTLPAAPQTYPLHRYTLYIHRSNHSLSLLSVFAYYLMFICSLRTKEHVLQCISGGDKNNSSVSLFHITWHKYNCSPIGQQNVSSSANCILIDTALNDQTATVKQVWVIRVISHVKRNNTYLSKYKDMSRVKKEKHGRKLQRGFSGKILIKGFVWQIDHITVKLQKKERI
jgi:hypothetical protein